MPDSEFYCHDCCGYVSVYHPFLGSDFLRCFYCNSEDLTLDYVEDLDDDDNDGIFYKVGEGFFSADTLN